MSYVFGSRPRTTNAPSAPDRAGSTRSAISMRAPATALPVVASVIRPRNSPGTWAITPRTPTRDASVNAATPSDRVARRRTQLTPACKNMKPVLARSRAGTGRRGKRRESAASRSTPRPSLEGVLCGSERGRSPGSRQSGLAFPARERASGRMSRPLFASVERSRSLLQWRGRAGFAPASYSLTPFTQFDCVEDCITRLTVRQVGWAGGPVDR